MPESIVFTIRPLTEARVPALLGRAAHAAVLRLIARRRSIACRADSR
jgi:hypothetical protein